MYKEGRDVLEEDMREKIDLCDMEDFNTVDTSEKTVAILWWPQAAKQEGGKISKTFLCDLWKQRNESPIVGGISIRRRNGAASRKRRVVNGQMTKASIK